MSDEIETEEKVGEATGEEIKGLEAKADGTLHELTNDAESAGEKFVNKVKVFVHAHVLGHRPGTTVELNADDPEVQGNIRTGNLSRVDE